MLAIERQHRILDMLSKSRVISTATAAKMLAVTEETVRRDFEVLEANGHLSRKHGGAMRISDGRIDLPLDSRETASVAEKKAIAKVALAQIQAGETLFFDASSTLVHLACLLANVNIEVTVLTNALKIAVELARHPAVEVILVGGAVNHSSLSCQGAVADLMLDAYHVQKAFMSCRGLDAQCGLSEANAEQAGLKRKIMKLSDQTIILADHTKMDLKSSYYFAKIKDIDILITDLHPGKKIKQALQRSGGKLLLSNNEKR